MGIFVPADDNFGIYVWSLVEKDKVQENETKHKLTTKIISGTKVSSSATLPWRSSRLRLESQVMTVQREDEVADE